MCIVTKVVLSHGREVEYLIYKCTSHATCKKREPRSYIIDHNTTIYVRPIASTCSTCIACALQPRLGELKAMRAEQKRRFDWMNLMAAHGELLTRDHEDLALMKVESDELWEKQMAVTKRILHADWVNKKLTLRAIDETARRTGKGIPEGLEKMFVAKNQESATTVTSQ